MLLFCLWQRGSGLHVKVFWYWNASFLLHALASDPRAGWGSRGRYHLCELGVQVSVLQNGRCVILGFLLPDTAWYNSKVHLEVTLTGLWQGLGGLCRVRPPRCELCLGRVQFLSILSLLPSPSSCQLLLEMFFPLFKVIADLVPKPSCRQALKINLQGGYFHTSGKSLGIFFGSCCLPTDCPSEASSPFECSKLGLRNKLSEHWCVLG